MLNMKIELSKTLFYYLQQLFRLLQLLYLVMCFSFLKKVIHSTVTSRVEDSNPAKRYYLKCFANPT